MARRPATATERALRERRRSKRVGVEVQPKLILTAFAVAAVALSVSLLASLAGLSGVARSPAGSPAAVVEQVRTVLFRQSLVAFLAVTPFAVWVGMSYLHKVCGPLYVILRHFQRFEDGPWNQPCRLRATDDLQDVKDAINSGMRCVVEQLEADRRALGAAREALLASTGEPRSDGSVVELIDAQLARLDRRLGGGDGDSSAATGDSEKLRAMTEAVS